MRAASVAVNVYCTVWVKTFYTPEVFWKYFSSDCEFLYEILHACYVYIYMPYSTTKFYSIISNIERSCPVKCNCPVNVYISLPASDGELQNQPVWIRSVLSWDILPIVDRNLVKSFSKLLQ